MSDPTTLASLLNITKDDVKQALSYHAQDEPGVAGVLKPAVALISDLATDKLNGALEVDCLEMLGQAWAKLNSLREYADPKKHPPGEAAVVQLGDHSVTHPCYPLLELKALGVNKVLTELKLTLELKVRFKSVALSIRDGKIMAAAPGEASVSAALKYKSFTLKEQSTPAWELPGEIAFGHGIPIPH